MVSLLAGCAQSYQESLGPSQICGLKALPELLEHWPQKRTGPFVQPLAGQQRRQVDGGAQFPCSRGLTPTQFKRLREGILCFVAIGFAAFREGGLLSHAVALACNRNLRFPGRGGSSGRST